jgi:hypothetical protein
LRPRNFSTRYYSDKQEKQIAKAVGGKQTKNSGATTWEKGDILLDDWLLEAKTTTKAKDTFTIRKEWIDKNREEAFQMGKRHSALVIQFEPDGENFYLIDQASFKRLLEQEKEN